MTADATAPDPKTVARELDDLRRMFERVLPEDAPVDYADKLDLKALEDLYQATEDCLKISVAMPSRFGADDEWRDAIDRATDLHKALSSSIINRLNRAVVETVPAPEVTSHLSRALDTSSRVASPLPVQMFLLLTTRCQDLTGQRPVSWWKADLETRLGHLVRFYQTQINKVLNSPDPPDMRALAADLLRMDVLYWVLQDLGMTKIAETLSANMKVTARLALNSAAEAAQRFLKDPDDLNRFDLAVVLSGIDDLIAVMERVMEDHLADVAKAEDDAFFQGLGMEAVTRFVSEMGHLILLMFDDLSRLAATGQLTYELFDRNIAKIERIYDFCRYADPLTENRVHRAASTVIQKRSMELVRDLSKAVATEEGEIIRQCLKRLETALARLKASTLS